MARSRVDFCGVIEGSVTLRDGETPEEAIDRAEAAIQRILDKSARSFRGPFTDSPTIGLEADS